MLKKRNMMVAQLGLLLVVVVSHSIAALAQSEDNPGTDGTFPILLHPPLAARIPPSTTPIPQLNSSSGL